MDMTLKVGDRNTFSFQVTNEKTVPYLYPESEEFVSMPEIFATGFMVGLMEWGCILSLKPTLKEGDGSVGTLIQVSHVSPTLPGMLVTITAVVSLVDGSRVEWHVQAHDELDLIGEGTIGRQIVNWDRFNSGLEKKRKRFNELDRD